MREAERIAAEEHGNSKVAVISGVGVRCGAGGAVGVGGCGWAGAACFAGWQGRLGRAAEQLRVPRSEPQWINPFFPS